MCLSRSIPTGAPEHTPLYLRFRNWGGGDGGEEGGDEETAEAGVPDIGRLDLMKACDAQGDMGDILGYDMMRAQPASGTGDGVPEAAIAVD